MPVEAFGGRGIVSTDEILRGDLAAILHGARGRHCTGQLRESRPTQF
jgi:hypothetical protein